MAFLKKSGRKYVLAARRGELTKFQRQLQSDGWHRLPENPEVSVKLMPEAAALSPGSECPRRKKERAIRRRQRRGLARGLQRLQQLISTGRLKNRDKILERVGRLTGRYPKARPFVTITVSKAKRAELSWSWNVVKFKEAMAREGAYLHESNEQAGRSRDSGRRTCS